MFSIDNPSRRLHQPTHLPKPLPKLRELHSNRQVPSRPPMHLRKLVRTLVRACRDIAHSVLTGVLIASLVLLPVPLRAEFLDENGNGSIWTTAGRSGHFFQIIPENGSPQW